MKKYIIKYVFFIIIFLFSKYSLAESYCNVLWRNNNLPTITGPSLLLTGGSGTVKLPLTINAGGQSTVVLSTSKFDINIPPVRGLDGTIRYWMQFPTAWQDYTGLKFRVISELDNAGGSTIDNIRTVVSPLVKSHWSYNDSFPCLKSGQTFSFERTSINGISIEIDPSMSKPGVYNIQLPLKVGYEENKGSFNGGDGYGWATFAALMTGFDYSNTNNFTIQIVSSCRIDKSIDIDFGDITDRQLLNGVTKRNPIYISCTTPSSVKLSLLNVARTDNSTKCGSGICTLTFDSGKSESNIKISSAGVSSIFVNTLLRSYSNSISPGAFSANMILALSYQ